LGRITRSVKFGRKGGGVAVETGAGNFKGTPGVSGMENFVIRKINRREGSRKERSGGRRCAALVAGKPRVS